MPTADDDTGPISHGDFKLPRALLNWEPRERRAELDAYPAPVSHRADFAGSGDTFEEDPTTAMAVVSYTLDRPDAPPVSRAPAAERVDAALARAVQLWRDHPLRAGAIVAGITLVTYFAVDAAWLRSDRSSQTMLPPSAAVRALGPITIEQLTETPQPRETVAAPPRGKRTDTAEGRSAARRVRETPAAPAGESGAARATVATQSKSGMTERSGKSAGAAGLPAWGTEAVRDFSGTKGAKATTATTDSRAPTARPAPTSADIPPPAPATPPGAGEEPKSAPAVAAKVAEPPEPVAPPPPSGPLTMEQMLSRVEDAAQAQRKKAGIKAPKSSENDAELEALINGAMKKK